MLLVKFAVKPEPSAMPDAQLPAVPQRPLVVSMFQVPSAAWRVEVAASRVLPRRKVRSAGVGFITSLVVFMVRIEG